MWILTYLVDGVYQEVTQEQLQQVLTACPQLADLLYNPDKIQDIPEPEILDQTNPILDHWDKAAKRLINQIWRFNASQIFHKPVDPDRLGIPDYFEVVKTPIDLGTIKQRLNHNQYASLQHVLDDIQLCFDNCLLYNGEDSPAGQRCLAVIAQFEKLSKQLNIDWYLTESALRY